MKTVKYVSFKEASEVVDKIMLLQIGDRIVDVIEELRYSIRGHYVIKCNEQYYRVFNSMNDVKIIIIENK